MNIDERQTREIAQDWRIRDWRARSYYDKAEREDSIRGFWRGEGHFRRLFNRLDTRVLVDLACGHGRHTAKILSTPELRTKVEQIYLVDVNEENTNFCRERFASVDFISTVVNNGHSFEPIQDSTVSAIFCYDAMVHFELDSIISYLQDAFRILVPGGRALFHHSNYDLSPGSDYKKNPHWRNFMSRNLFAHIASRAGLKMLEQVVIDWDSKRKLDCISLVEKPVTPGSIELKEPGIFRRIKGLIYLNQLLTLPVQISA